MEGQCTWGHEYGEGNVLELFPPSAKTGTIRLLTALSYTIEPKLSHLDVEHVSGRSDLNYNIYIYIYMNCGSISGEIGCLKGSEYRL